MPKKKVTKKTTKKYTYGLGRRKSSIATVRLFQGKGDDLVNGKKVEQVYKRKSQLTKLYLPFEYTKTEGKFYFHAKTRGGGVEGQLDAIVLGISRAFVKVDESFKSLLKKGKLLTRDSRKKERKKPGLKKARKKEQYSKR